MRPYFFCISIIALDIGRNILLLVECLEEAIPGGFEDRTVHKCNSSFIGNYSFLS
jgi:hypothetical protein